MISLFFTLSIAQRHVVGSFAGGANVIGDIGRTNYIIPLPVSYGSNSLGDRIPFAVGAIYRFNFNPYMGVRFNGIFCRVVGADASAPEYYKRERNYAFKNNIIEGSLVLEYNIFDINDEH